MDYKPSAISKQAATAGHARPELQAALRTHSLFWLAAANTVGVLLAALLLFPSLGDGLRPFTYGRWIPLHLNWHLYGWCSLPLLGPLFVWIGGGPTPAPARIARVSLSVWFLALAACGLHCLAGHSSGKLFLDWTGHARPLLPAAMTVLWTALAWQGWTGRHRLRRTNALAQAAFLLLLLAVPPALFWASGPEVYPSVNPRSGGATGSSLLASTLGIVALYGLLPSLLSLPERTPKFRQRLAFVWTAFALSALACAFLDHGHASSTDPRQQAGLALLLLWVPLGWFHFRTYAWTPAAQRWLAAAAFWWLLLISTGWVIFLPDIAAHFKFTNALVAHSHLALAGLVTAMNLALLNQLAPDRPLTRGFWVWQLATAAQFVLLSLTGWLESQHPAAFYYGAPWTQTLYAARLLAGLAMWAVSLHWYTTRHRQNAPAT